MHTFLHFRRLHRTVAVAAALTLAGVAQAQTIRVGAGDNAALAEQVRSALASAAELQDLGTDLRIDSRGGQILLSGWVGHEDDRQLARTLAAQVPGVSGVSAQLLAWSTAADPHSGQPPQLSAQANAGGVQLDRSLRNPADRALAERIRAVLAETTAAAHPDTDLSIGAEGGRVLLSGWVNNADAAGAAVAAARSVDGVSGVQADLRLWSSGSDTPAQLGLTVPTAQPETVGASTADQALARQVRAALLASAPFQESAASLRVAVQDGQVRLHGWVGYADDAQAARKLAAAVPGVRSVHSQLKSWSSESRISG